MTRLLVAGLAVSTLRAGTLEPAERDRARPAAHVPGEIVVEVEDEELGSVPMHNVTPRLSATPGGFRLPAPFVGQHNAALLEAARTRPLRDALLIRRGKRKGQLGAKVRKAERERFEEGADFGHADFGRRV